MSLLRDANVTSTTTYEFKPEAISLLIATDLGLPVERVSVHFVIQEVGGDPMDRYRGTDTVTSIRVTVKS